MYSTTIVVNRNGEFLSVVYLFAENGFNVIVAKPTWRKIDPKDPATTDDDVENNGYFPAMFLC